MAEVWEYSDQELRELAQGCTELSCMYHGEINRELHDRGARRG